MQRRARTAGEQARAPSELLTRARRASRSFFQQLVILSFASPAAVALGSSAPLNGLDALATALYLALVGGEALADYQQLRFQTEKYRRLRAQQPAGEYARGFIESVARSSPRHTRTVGSLRRPAQPCGARQSLGLG